MKNKKSIPSIWTKDFTLVFFANVFLQMGINMSYGILSLWAEALGGNAAQIGFVCSVFAVSAFLLKFVAAPMIDSFNKRSILIFAVLLLILSFVCYGLSRNCIALGFANLVRGAGTAFGTTTALVIATDSLPRERIGEGIGFFSLSQVFCSAAGPFVALNASAVIGFEPTFYASAIIEAIAVSFLVQIKKGDDPRKKFRISLNGVISIKVIPVTIFAFLMAIPYATLQSFVALYGINRGIPQEYIGLFFTVYASALLIVRPICGKLADRIGYSKILVPSGFVYCLTFILLAATTNIVFYLLAALSAAFGYGVCQSLFQALSMKLSTPEQRGAASCTYYYGVDGGFFVGPTIAGIFVFSFGYQAMWYAMILPILICVIAVILFKRFVPIK